MFKTINQNLRVYSMYKLRVDTFVMHYILRLFIEGVDMNFELDAVSILSKIIICCDIYQSWFKLTFVHVNLIRTISQHNINIWKLRIATWWLAISYVFNKMQDVSYSSAISWRGHAYWLPISTISNQNGLSNIYVNLNRVACRRLYSSWCSQIN